MITTAHNVDIEIPVLLSNMKSRFSQRLADLEYQCALKDTIIARLQAQLDDKESDPTATTVTVTLVDDD